MTFQLNENIERDSALICNLKLSQLRLIKDGDLDWFLLIPTLPNIIEWTDLKSDDQLLLNQEMNLVASKLKEVCTPDKINIASLGNMVPQFHLHIIARYKDDRAWPNAIWGTKANKEFDLARVDFWKAHFSSDETVA